MSAAPEGAAKRALLIGIDKYANLSQQYQLEGCTNDVLAMERILVETFGFPDDNVLTLTNEDATRDAILAAMEDLVVRTEPDDIVLIQYSGHGSQRRDQEGDEPDGWDETIMPADSGRGAHPNLDITDDEIYYVLKRLSERTSYITLIFDCCHSGTITRDAFGVKSRWVARDERPVEELPPSSVPADLFGGGARGTSPSGWLPMANAYVLVAGCRDEESSYEYRSSQGDETIIHGSLTYHLCQELPSIEPGTTYRDVFERVSSKVTAANSNQHPQMEGKLDREIFGVRDIEPMRYVRISKREGDTVTLAAGAAQGLTIGSEWAVHPATTKAVTEDAERLGMVEITRVQAVTAEARIVDEPVDGAIQEHARAVEEAHAFGDMRLRVEVVGPSGHEAALEAMAGQIEGSKLLTVVDREDLADARVYLIEPRETATLEDPVPQLGRLTDLTWAAVTENGELMMPPKSTDAAGDVRDNLDKLARYRQSIRLENPDSSLRGKVKMELLKRRGDGSWAEVEAESAGGSPVFRDGDCIAARVTNDHTEPLYIYLVDYGLTGGVTPVYPMFGANEALEPGRSVDIGIRDGQALFELGMPEGFPFGTNPFVESPREGVETFKLFVTSKEADFGFLAQERVRAIRREGPGGSLQLLMETAAEGPATRDLKIAKPAPEDDWTAVNKPFVLRAQ